MTDWYQKACREMTNCDHEGQIFLFHPHTNYGFFFFLTTKYLILFGNIKSPYLCFISYLYLDLYVLGDDAWIS